MTRLLVSLIALLLPLQFAWSAASAYCQHESSAQPAHFGHHFHSHEGEKAAGSALAADADCAACHATGTPAIGSEGGIAPLFAASTAIAMPIRPAFTSAPARVPDRPQWPRLV